MFGYAANETDVLMPAPIQYAQRLMERQAEARKSGLLPWLRPDAKSQVTFRYENGKPVAVDAIVLSTQHAADVSDRDIHDGVMDLVIKHVIPAQWMSKETKIYINLTGRFEIGGPMGDCGLTGRKIIVDSYGGMPARHGGGAFLRQRPIESGSLGGVCRLLCGQKYCRRWFGRLPKFMSYASLCGRTDIGFH